MSTHPGNFLDVIQGSREWFEARCGTITASRTGDVVAIKVNGEAKVERDHYRAELVAERLTRQPYPRFVSQDMRWGLEQEPFARAAYELDRGVLVETAGFVLHPDIAGFGCSPDGLIGDDGLLQIKCPATATHLKWLLAGAIPEEHCPQMLSEMSCTGRIWCDFMSFDPRMPEHLQKFIIRFHRDEDLIRKQNRVIVHFRQEIESVLARLPRGPQNVVNILDYKNSDEVEL